MFLGERCLKQVPFVKDPTARPRPTAALANPGAQGSLFCRGPECEGKFKRISSTSGTGESASLHAGGGELDGGARGKCVEKNWEKTWKNGDLPMKNGEKWRFTYEKW